MSNLKGLVDGEYSDYSSMSGINSATGLEELLGRIRSLRKEDQGKAVKNLLRKRAHNERTSRSEMESKLDQIPSEILKGLIDKRLQLADGRFYVVKDISLKNSIDVFMGTDPKAVGVGNLAQQKLDKDTWYLLFALTMRSCITDPNPLTADFGHIEPWIRNGEFEFEVGNKKIVAPIDNSVFDTRQRTDVQIGYWGWDNCKIIEPQVEIKMPVKFASGAPANAFLRVGFVGTAVIPY